MDQQLSLFDFTFVDNKVDHTLFLLHGTGGTKGDFLFFNEQLHKKYNLVGLQGNVDEDGLPRFFKRFSSGVFDQESIKDETEKLKKFIEVWKQKHKTAKEQLFFLGYSNGANILLAAVFYYPDLLKNLVLLHPMLPFQPRLGSLDLSGLRIFVSNGIHDSIITQSEQSSLIKTLQSCHAELTIKEYSSGHHITATEIHDVISFLL